MPARRHRWLPLTVATTAALALWALAAAPRLCLADDLAARCRRRRRLATLPQRATRPLPRPPASTARCKRVNAALVIATALVLVAAGAAGAMRQTQIPPGGGVRPECERRRGGDCERQPAVAAGGHRISLAGHAGGYAGRAREGPASSAVVRRGSTTVG